MRKSEIELLPELEKYIQRLDFTSIPQHRKEILQQLITFGKDQQKEIQLNFICTHNSRRSQFAQLWAQLAAACYGVELSSYSGGLEVTAFNPRAVNAVQRTGFHVQQQSSEDNPEYELSFSAAFPAVKMFSKHYDHPRNPSEGFAAVMTCSHADENCPFIPGAEKRIPLNYEDPKDFDDTPLESEKYDERCRQIATEMFYAFSQIKQE